MVVLLCTDTTESATGACKFMLLAPRHHWISHRRMQVHVACTRYKGHLPGPPASGMARRNRSPLTVYSHETHSKYSPNCAFGLFAICRNVARPHLMYVCARLGNCTWSSWQAYSSSSSVFSCPCAQPHHRMSQKHAEQCMLLALAPLHPPNDIADQKTISPPS